MSKKKRAVSAAVVVSALALSGCAGTDEPADASTITMYMWTSSQTEVESWESIAALVTEEYPEITIEFETADWSNYWTKLVADASGSSGPCIVGIQSLRLPGVADLLAPLDTAMADNGIDASDFDASIMEAMQVDGEQKVIPYDFGPLVMYYNKDAFAEAGIDAPAPEWTVDDYEQILAQLSGDGGYGTVIDANVDYTLPWTLNLGGVQAVNEDGELALTDQGYVAALERLAGWVQEGYAPELSSASSGSGLDQFLSGNAATVIDGPWNLINAISTAQFEVGIAPVPSGPAGQGSVTAGSGFGVTKSCDDPDAAYKALSVITGAEAAETLGSAGRAFPARIAQQSAWFENVDDESRSALEYAAEHTEGQRTTADWTAVVDAFSQYGVEAFNGATSMNDFVATVQDAGTQ